MMILTPEQRIDEADRVARDGQERRNVMGARYVVTPRIECPNCLAMLVDSQPTLRCPCCGYRSGRNI